MVKECPSTAEKDFAGCILNITIDGKHQLGAAIILVLDHLLSSTNVRRLLRFSLLLSFVFLCVILLKSGLFFCLLCLLYLSLLKVKLLVSLFLVVTALSVGELERNCLSFESSMNNSL